MSPVESPVVSIIMGSKTDFSVMENAVELLKDFKVHFEVSIVSAHRTPQKMVDFATTAQGRGIKVIIAGAGGAAHLPGMVASLTTLPVIGVPVKSALSLDGWDSILSILQMPTGVPVATVALNAAANAALLAVQILALHDAGLQTALTEYKEGLMKKVEEQSRLLRSEVGKLHVED